MQLMIISQVFIQNVKSAILTGIQRSVNVQTQVAQLFCTTMEVTYLETNDNDRLNGYLANVSYTLLSLSTFLGNQYSNYSETYCLGL